MADTVGVGQETEKCDDPENRPEKYAFMKLWEPQLHLNMAFVEPGMDTGVLVGTAADNFLCVSLPKSPSARIFPENGTVRGRAVNLRINGGRKTEINTAGFQNQLIQMKNFRFPAPEVDFSKLTSEA